MRTLEEVLKEFDEKFTDESQWKGIKFFKEERYKVFQRVDTR